MFRVIRIEENENIHRIYFKGDIESDNAILVCRLKDSGRFVVGVSKEEFCIECKRIDKNNYTVDINTNDFLNKYSQLSYEKEIIWLYIKVDDNYYNLDLNKETYEKIRKLKEIKLNSLSSCKAIVRNNSTLGYRIMLNEIEAKIVEIDINNRLVSIQSEVKISGGERIPNYTVCLGKRVFNKILKYLEFLLKYNVENDNMSKFEIDVSLFNTIKNYGIYYIDFMVEIKKDNVLIRKLLKIDGFSRTRIGGTIDNLYKYELYKTAEKTLAIRVEKFYSYKIVKEINITDGILKILLDEDDIFDKKVKIQVYRKVDGINKCDDILFYEKEVRSNEDLYLNLKEVFYMDVNYIQEYYIVLNIEEELYSLKAEKEIIKDYKNIEINIEKEMNINVNEIYYNQVKLAVLGSCFSRAAFNSKDEYFNLDYKKYIQITYSDFWISLINVYSKKIDYCREKYFDIPDKDIDHIERLYLKDTFKRMEKEEVEYILIDLFTDAVHGVRKVGKDMYLGQNGKLHKSSYYFKDLMINTKNFDYRDIEFWDVWKEACDKFVEDVKVKGLEKKIILNCSSLTYEYYDEHGKRRSFDKENKFKNQDITYFNSIWNRMNNYLLSKLPNIDIINLDKYNFISSYNHPINCGPHHFETAYYKKLKDELIAIILEKERKKNNRL